MMGCQALNAPPAFISIFSFILLNHGCLNGYEYRTCWPTHAGGPRLEVHSANHG